MQHIKKVQRISDQIALQTLPLVLKGKASTWWLGIKDSIDTWVEFEKRWRHAFAPKKPGYFVFQGVFACRQPANMLTESLIAKNRALLAQLPLPKLDEGHQLDIIYGQLNVNIRQKVTRDSVYSFDDLLQAARGVEQLLKEKPNSTSNYIQLNPNETQTWNNAVNALEFKGYNHELVNLWGRWKPNQLQHKLLPSLSQHSLVMAVVHLESYVVDALNAQRRTRHV